MEASLEKLYVDIGDKRVEKYKLDLGCLLSKTA